MFKKITKLSEPTEPDLNFPANLKWRKTDRWAWRMHLINTYTVYFGMLHDVSLKIATDREVTVFKKTRKISQPTEPDLNLSANLKWRESDRWARRTPLMNVAIFCTPQPVSRAPGPTLGPICRNPALPKSSIFDGQISIFQTALTLRVLNRLC